MLLTSPLSVSPVVPLSDHEIEFTLTVESETTRLETTVVGAEPKEALMAALPALFACIRAPATSIVSVLSDVIVLAEVTL